MATKRFCDICDTQLTPADDQPFVRELAFYSPGDREANQLPDRKAVAFIAITNEENHPLTDVCSGCKLRIVTDGQPPAKPVAVATLQPNLASDTPVAITPFRLSEKPPILPRRPPAHQPPEPIRYEPSLPVHQSDQ